ncbi:L-lactate dehydrogenase [Actinomycetota bacterium]|nr:L-lactate dehydrogenase [Actinomycetota bacterium]
MGINKITIVGAGAVGSTTAFALASSGLAREIVLLDVNEKLANAEALDISHGSLFYPAVDIVGTADQSAATDSQMIIVTAGARQKPGQTRIDLAADSIKILESVLPPLAKVAPDAIFLIVANPVDALTYAAQKITGFGPAQVFGSGTNLDSSRLRTLLSQRTGVNPKSIHAYIAGEHGDSEIPLWSSATIGNVPLLDFKELPGFYPLTSKCRDEIISNVVNAAYTVIEGKGATNYAVALAVVDIVTAVLRDENRILPVSSLIEGVDGVEDVCMSLPFVVGAKGAQQRINTSFSTDELRGLQKSAVVLRRTITECGF